MESIVDLERLLHRSRERIKQLGEVFTPEEYIEHMLDLLSKGKTTIWSDEETSFFEPCAGHGNIVISIYRRRLEAMYKKGVARGVREPHFYAVANAINTLWAIDIDRKNIENCRSRVLDATLLFLRGKQRGKSNADIVGKKKDFFAHVLSAIQWHIHENETLSSLSAPESATKNAGLTKSGSKWLHRNAHKPLNFQLTWVEHFDQCETDGLPSLAFQRAKKFIESALLGNKRGFEDYLFARNLLLDDSNSNGSAGARTSAGEV